jgi:hypothetical protein
MVQFPVSEFQLSPGMTKKICRKPKSQPRIEHETIRIRNKKPTIAPKHSVVILMEKAFLSLFFSIKIKLRTLITLFELGQQQCTTLEMHT